jgi:hypothetical protein
MSSTVTYCNFATPAAISESPAYRGKPSGKMMFIYAMPKRLRKLEDGKEGTGTNMPHP